MGARGTAATNLNVIPNAPIVPAYPVMINNRLTVFVFVEFTYSYRLGNVYVRRV